MVLEPILRAAEYRCWKACPGDGEHWLKWIGTTFLTTVPAG